MAMFLMSFSILSTQSIIRGQKKSKWLDTFSKCSVKMVPVPVYIDDQEQIDLIYSHPSSILDSTPTHTHSDEIKFIMDVLFPEVGLVLAVLCMVRFTLFLMSNSLSIIWKGRDVWPSMVNHTQNLCSAFNPSKYTHTHTHTHRVVRSERTHTRSNMRPLL